MPFLVPSSRETTPTARRNSVIPDRNLGSAADGGELVPSSPSGTHRVRVRPSNVRVICGMPLSPVSRVLDRLPVPIGIQISHAREISAIGDFPKPIERSSGSARAPCSRWKARSLLRCGRPTDGAVEAFGSARRDSCESVTLRCGGRLKRPPITFHPLRSRVRPRPTLLRASPLPTLSDGPTLRESSER